MANRKRKSFNDVRSIGRSELIPFDHQESWQARHERRKRVNLEYRNDFEAWCKLNDWTFKIKNDGHHWMLRKGKNYIQWWPSSAKLIINEQWNKGIHCHDYEQLKKILQKEATKY